MVGLGFWWNEYRTEPIRDLVNPAYWVKRWRQEDLYDPATGVLIPGVWERWLTWDPVRMVKAHAAALRSMKAIYIDAGKRDQFFLDLGAEAFRRALASVGVTDVFFELFDATHSNIEYRYPIGLKYLAERLAPE